MLMSFDKINNLMEQCSICKDCGTTKDDCIKCEKGNVIKEYWKEIYNQERENENE